MLCKRLCAHIIMLPSVAVVEQLQSIQINSDTCCSPSAVWYWYQRETISTRTWDIFFYQAFWRWRCICVITWLLYVITVNELIQYWNYPQNGKVIWHSSLWIPCKAAASANNIHPINMTGFVFLLSAQESSYTVHQTQQASHQRPDHLISFSRHSSETLLLDRHCISFMSEV